MTPKEALAKDGTVAVSMGRGRLSAAGIERCKVLASQGWDIKGYKVSTTVNAEPVVTKTAVSNGEKTIADLPPLRYDEKAFKAVSDTPVFGSTTFGMREVCRTCHTSLSYHFCDNPVILGVSVRIVTK